VLKHWAYLAGRQTSISIKAPFWSWLAEIPSSFEASRADLIERVNRNFNFGYLPSALRAFVLQTYLQKGCNPKIGDRAGRAGAWHGFARCSG